MQWQNLAVIEGAQNACMHASFRKRAWSCMHVRALHTDTHTLCSSWGTSWCMWGSPLLWWRWWERAQSDKHTANKDVRGTLRRLLWGLFDIYSECRSAMAGAVRLSPVRGSLFRMVCAAAFRAWRGTARNMLAAAAHMSFRFLSEGVIARVRGQSR